LLIRKNPALFHCPLQPDRAAEGGADSGLRIEGAGRGGGAPARGAGSYVSIPAD